MLDFIIKFLQRYVIKRPQEASSYGTSYDSGTGKRIISSSETVVFSTKTKKLIEKTQNEVLEINKSADSNPEYLIDYITNSGTNVYRIKNASKTLEKIKEHTGFICAMEGPKALYLNTILSRGFSSNTEPLFIIDSEKETDYYMLLREFYLWYSMRNGLGGFDFSTQELFKQYLSNKNRSLKGLRYETMCALQEAIARDFEANEFVIGVLQNNEGGKKVLKKMQDGGAQI